MEKNFESGPHDGLTEPQVNYTVIFYYEVQLEL